MLAWEQHDWHADFVGVWKCNHNFDERFAMARFAFAAECFADGQQSKHQRRRICAELHPDGGSSSFGPRLGTKRPAIQRATSRAGAGNGGVDFFGRRDMHHAATQAGLIALRRKQN